MDEFKAGMEVFSEYYNREGTLLERFDFESWQVKLPNGELVLVYEDEMVVEEDELPYEEEEEEDFWVDEGDERTEIDEWDKDYASTLEDFPELDGISKILRTAEYEKNKE